ncbi:MAG TPA: hypothetical protein VEV41_05920 [Terriglobales bacterium]|nr:hypothetical protein [Terriglobales bacterium]
MHTAVGIFGSRAAAEQAVRKLLENRIPEQSIIFLTADQSETKIASLRTTDAEPEGMGKAMGAYLGGVMGASAGLSLGSAIASLFVPGVGPIPAAGMGAAAAIGLGGATAGASIGHASEDTMDEGIPKDDVIFYRHLLKQGRSIVLVNCHSEDQVAPARALLDQTGSEDVDTARKQWQEPQFDAGSQRAA